MDNLENQDLNPEDIQLPDTTTSKNVLDEISSESGDYHPDDEIEKENEEETNYGVTLNREPVATSYSPGPDETSENGTEFDSAQKKMLAASSNGDPEVCPDDIVAGDVVPGEDIHTIIPRSEDNDYVKADRNVPALDEDEESHQQHPVSPSPGLVERTSWHNCCGLFQVLRRSSD